MTDRVNVPAAQYKPRIMQFLWDHRPSAGNSRAHAPWKVDPAVDATMLAARLGLPLHDLVHVLWSLQKMDAIRFHERKRAPGRCSTVKASGNHGIGRGNLDHFVITKIGEQLQMGYMNGQGDALAAAPKTLPGIAVMQITNAESEALLTAADMRREARASKRMTTQDAIRDMVASGAHPVGLTPAVPDPAEPAPEPSFVDHVLGRPGSPQTAETVPTAGKSHPPLDPALATVLARHVAYQKVRDAAASLEAVGLEDAALQMLASDTESALEQAISELLLALGYQP